MSVKEIVIGRDYTEVPGGRYEKYGAFSGEDFRNNVLSKALRDFDEVEVYLDGAKSYMSSFLEEAFGGLIRECKFTPEELSRKLKVMASAKRYAIYLKMIEQDMRAAANEAAGDKPGQVA